MKFLNHLIPPILTKFYKAIQKKNGIHLLFLELKLKLYPRNKLTKSKILGKSISIPDFASFYWTYLEIFEEEIYRFTTEYNKELIIVDAGSNIGLSIIYLKNLYPNSKIYGFEADKEIFDILKSNVELFDHSEIYLFNDAVWNKDTKLLFSSDGADGGKVNNSTAEKGIAVNAIDFDKFLSNFSRIDFLKMDIEGAEEIVFPKIASQLNKIEKLFIEYHSSTNEDQNLSVILQLLKEAGFRVHLNSIFKSDSPFKGLKTNSGFDNQINIFASKSFNFER